MTKSLKLTKISIIIASVFLAVFMLATNIRTATAESGSESTLSTDERAEIEERKAERLAEQQKKTEERKKELEAKRAELEAKQQENKEKLTEKRLEQCKKVESRINENMQRIADRKTKQVEVFNKIADRTMAFYEENGLSLENYDALVSDVVAKRGLAEAEIENLKSATIDFKCDTENPLKVSDAFKQARESLVSTMKEYKTSVKNLIVGVKSVAPSDDSPEGEAR